MFLQSPRQVCRPPGEHPGPGPVQGATLWLHPALRYKWGGHESNVPRPGPLPATYGVALGKSRPFALPGTLAVLCL